MIDIRESFKLVNETDCIISFTSVEDKQIIDFLLAALNIELFPTPSKKVH